MPLPVEKTQAHAGVINARVYSVSRSDFFTKFTFKPTKEQLSSVTSKCDRREQRDRLEVRTDTAVRKTVFVYVFRAKKYARIR